MKMAENSPKGQKTLWEKEKLLFTSNFFFSNSVFKRLVLQTHESKGLFGKGFRHYCIPKFNPLLHRIWIIWTFNYNYDDLPRILHDKNAITYLLPEQG